MFCKNFPRKILRLYFFPKIYREEHFVVILGWRKRIAQMFLSKKKKDSRFATYSEMTLKQKYMQKPLIWRNRNQMQVWLLFFSASFFFRCSRTSRLAWCRKLKLYRNRRDNENATAQRRIFYERFQGHKIFSAIRNRFYQLKFTF